MSKATLKEKELRCIDLIEGKFKDGAYMEKGRAVLRRIRQCHRR